MHHGPTDVAPQETRGWEGGGLASNQHPGEAGTGAVTQPAGAGPAERLNPHGPKRGWQQTQEARSRLSRSAQGTGPSGGSQSGPHWREPGGRPESRSLASDCCSEPRKQTRGPAAETRAETSRLPPRRWSRSRVRVRVGSEPGERRKGPCRGAGGRCGPTERARLWLPLPASPGRRPRRELTQPAQESTRATQPDPPTLPPPLGGAAPAGCPPLRVPGSLQGPPGWRWGDLGVPTAQADRRPSAGAA